MTAQSMMPAIGHKVTLRCETLEVYCEITDVKFVYGKPRVQVKPLAGDGLRWVELSSLSSLAIPFSYDRGIVAA